MRMKLEKFKEVTEGGEKESAEIDYSKLMGIKGNYKNSLEELKSLERLRKMAELMPDDIDLDDSDLIGRDIDETNKSPEKEPILKTREEWEQVLDNLDIDLEQRADLDFDLALSSVMHHTRR